MWQNYPILKKKEKKPNFFFKKKGEFSIENFFLNF
jgi:hypothetical protein